MSRSRCSDSDGIRSLMRLTGSMDARLQSPRPIAASEKRAFLRRHQLGAGEVQAGGALGTEPGRGAALIDRFSRGGDQKRRSHGDRRGVEPHVCGRKHGAAGQQAPRREHERSDRSLQQDSARRFGRRHVAPVTHNPHTATPVSPLPEGGYGREQGEPDNSGAIAPREPFVHNGRAKPFRRNGHGRAVARRGDRDCRPDQ
jgi:hypothetical protein